MGEFDAAVSVFGVIFASPAERAATELARVVRPGGRVAVTSGELVHEHGTPEEVWDRWERSHPIWVGARRLLEPAGEWERLREDSIAALRDGAAAQGGARSPYLLAVLDRR